MYIRDVSSHKGSKSDGAWNLPRFHLASCETLQQMRRGNRYEKYVVAAGENGLFDVNFIENNRTVKSSSERLRVCQNCLALLAFDGFRASDAREVREEKVTAFDLKRFFQEYPRALFLQQPAERSDSAPLNVYPDDFEALATRIKNERGWRCEEVGCGVDLAAGHLRRYLHLHHRNGQKHDSRADNLILLCAVCHAQQPYHSHMSNLPDVERFRPIRAQLLAKSGTSPQDSQGVVTGADAFSDEGFRSYARVHGLDVDDHRRKGGALWVRPGAHSADVLAQLKSWSFKFKEGKGWWRA